MHDPKKRRCVWAEGAFGGNSVHLNLPVPYRPGDILEVSCDPYVSEPHYCILTEVGDDCCGVQCLYPGAEARALFLQLLLRIVVSFAAVWNHGLRGRAAQRMRIYGASVRKAP